jgi:hypothetical protein
MGVFLVTPSGIVPVCVCGESPVRPSGKGGLYAWVRAQPTVQYPPINSLNGINAEIAEEAENAERNSFLLLIKIFLGVLSVFSAVSALKRFA